MLDGLVALARHHHHVAAPRRLERESDRLPPVELDARSRRVGASLDLPRYLLRVLGIGVVRGYDAEVRQPGSDPAHLRALGPVPVPGRPENADDTPFSGLRHAPGHPEDGI